VPHVLASLGLRVFPVDPLTKRSLITQFYDRATRNHAKIARWLQRWPKAGWAIVTGQDGGVVILDIDRKEDKSGKIVIWGIENLHRAGIVFLPPATPTQITPSGGYHLLFRHPGVFVPTGHLKINGKKLDGIEVKGDGRQGHCILAGPGYEWLPCYPPTLPLLPPPTGALMPPAPPHQAAGGGRLVSGDGDYTAYGEGAVDRIVDDIRTAGRGNQEETLNKGAYAIGQLVAGDEIAASYGLKLLDWLAPRVESLDARRPWGPGEVQKKLERAYLAGQRRPRSARS